jgi:diguanylate cyclase (GGDEF)-like protein
MDPTPPLQLADRIYLERVRQFFGHAGGNVLAAWIAAMLLGSILRDAGVPGGTLINLAFVLFGLSLLVYVVEVRFRKVRLNVKNAKLWVMARMVSGSLVLAMLGMAIFLLPAPAAIQHEVFFYVVLIAALALSCMSYAVMPFYYLLLDLALLMPLTVYFLQRDGGIHMTLAVSAVLAQAFIVAKAWRVSKTAITTIRLNEQLRDEIDLHKQTKEKLLHIATHDALTGLPNRQLLIKQLGITLKQAHRNGSSVALMFLDLDGFKAVNDAYGHDAGDGVLVEVAARLKSIVRGSDIVARLGGDEFVVVYSGVAKTHAEMGTLAEGVIASLALPIALPGGTTGSIGTSIGIGIYPDDSTDMELLMKCADNAMYEAKKRGKNGFSFYTAEIRADSQTPDGTSTN